MMTTVSRFGETFQVNAALLDVGADLEAKIEGGWTPLHTAAAKGFPAAVQAPMDPGADPMARADNGETPWDAAQRSEAFKGTEAYWHLNDARFE